MFVRERKTGYTVREMRIEDTDREDGYTRRQKLCVCKRDKRRWFTQGLRNDI